MPIVAQFIDTLDETRARERAQVHFPGRAEYMLDFLRMGMVFEAVDDYRALYESIPQIGSHEVVGVRDRFKRPAPSGYRDLKFYLKDKSNGLVSSLRFVAKQQLEAQTRLFLHEAMISITEVKHQLGDQPTGFVVIADNFQHNEKDALTLVHGFADLEGAVTYAKLRTYDKVRRLSRLARSSEELRMLWFLFGEEAVSGQLPFDGRYHLVSSQMDSMLLEAPVWKPLASWTELAQDLKLVARPLVRLLDEGDYEEDGDDEGDGEDDAEGGSPNGTR